MSFKKVKRVVIVFVYIVAFLVAFQVLWSFTLTLGKAIGRGGGHWNRFRRRLFRQEIREELIPISSNCSNASLLKYPKSMFLPDLPPACELNKAYVASPVFCESSVSDSFLLVLVISKADHFNQRYRQRSLLLRSRFKMTPEFVDRNRWRYAFVVGKAKGRAKEEIQLKIAAEACHFQDILHVDVLEDYYNLTRKKMAAFDYLLQQEIKFEILLKTDDDCFINVQTILEWLRSVTPAAYKNAIGLLKKRGVSVTKSAKYFFAGACRLGATPNRNPKSKWYLSKKDYLPKVLPPICNGPGYFLSYNVVAAMAALPGDQMRSFRLEDVHTAILVKRTGLVANEAVIITKRVAIMYTSIRRPVCVEGQFPTVVVSTKNSDLSMFRLLLDHFMKRDKCT